MTACARAGGATTRPPTHRKCGGVLAGLSGAAVCKLLYRRRRPGRSRGGRDGSWHAGSTRRTDSEGGTGYCGIRRRIQPPQHQRGTATRGPGPPPARPRPPTVRPLPSDARSSELAGPVRFPQTRAADSEQQRPAILDGPVRNGGGRTHNSEGGPRRLGSRAFFERDLRPGRNRDGSRLQRVDKSVS